MFWFTRILSQIETQVKNIKIIRVKSRVCSVAKYSMDKIVAYNFATDIRLKSCEVA